MARTPPRREQRENRKWQCQAIVGIGNSSDASAELNAHVCSLPAEHLGMHLCWCGSAFDDLRNVYTQRRLPI